MYFSKRVSSIQPSATLTINAKAQEMRAQGENVISLAAGEPDFPTPDHIVQSAKQALDEDFTKYTAVPGIPELRQAVADYFSENYHIQCREQDVMVSNGGKQCLYNLLQALVDPGDEVLIPSPYWVSYPAFAQLAEAVPVIVNTDPDTNFLVHKEKLEKSLTSKTKVLILNTPSNPTGCHYNQQALDELAEWAVSKNIFVICDEMYDQLVYPPAEPASLCSFWSRHPDMIAVVNGLSKTFSMTGWRVGFVLAHPELIKAMSKIQGQSTSNVCSFVQKASVTALRSSFEEVSRMRESFARRRDLVMDIISSWPQVECPRPDGGFYVFPRVDSYYNKDMDSSNKLCQAILEEEKVALVPGEAFGDDRCLRISYPVSDEILKDSLNRIGNFLARI